MSGLKPRAGIKSAIGRSSWHIINSVIISASNLVSNYVD
jgi:hypothetical protein